MQCNLCLKNTDPSVEHIIPKALGGKLTSKDIWCEPCNNKLGQILDAEISLQIGFFADALGVGHNNSHTMVNENGEKVVVGEKLIPRPIIRIHIPEGKPIIIPSKNEQIRNQNVKKQIRGLEKKYKVTPIETILPPPGEPIYPTNYLSSTPTKFAVKGKLLEKAIVKIAVNFYLFNQGSRNYILDAINYLTEDFPWISVLPYYPNNSLYEPSNGEVSHILYVKGSTKDRLLFAYIELFNFFNYIVILNREYTGLDIENRYRNPLVGDPKSELDFTITKMNLDDYLSFPNLSTRQQKFNRLEKQIQAIQDLFIKDK